MIAGYDIKSLGTFQEDLFTKRVSNKAPLAAYETLFGGGSSEEEEEHSVPAKRWPSCL